MVSCAQLGRSPMVVSPVAGEWTYTGPGRGLAVTLELWSPAGDSVAGRVLYWVAGDVVLPAERFGRIAGRHQRDGRVHLELPVTPPAPSITIDGTLTGDTLTIERASQGEGAWPAGQLGGGRFVRRH